MAKQEGFDFKKHFKQREKYLRTIYSDTEIEQIRQTINYSRKEVDHVVRLFLRLDESFRIVKKHYKISDKQVNKLVSKHRVPALDEAFKVYREKKKIKANKK